MRQIRSLQVLETVNLMAGGKITKFEFSKKKKKYKSVKSILTNVYTNELKPIRNESENRDNYRQ